MINRHIRFSSRSSYSLTGFFILTMAIILMSFSTANADHFSPIWGNQNPQQWMNVVVTSATIDGIGIATNDEIAVFDVDATTGDEVCVGYLVNTGGTGPYFINAGQDAGYGGFTPGNPIFFRLWDSSASREISLTDVVFDLTPPLVNVFTTNGLASATIDSYSFNTWFGTTDGNWNNSSNWDTGIVPSANNDVYIPSSGVNNFPELTSSSTGECDNIILEATSTERASIIGNQYLTINGTTKVQSYISADQWHIISAPVAGIDAGFFSLGGDPKVYLTEYDEELETYTYITSPSTSLNAIQGYMLWVCDTDHIYEYNGTMNSGTYGSADNLLRNTSGSGNEGWNMVGNPYPSSMDWDASSGWTKSANLGDAIYFYNDGVWDYYLDDSPSGHSTNGTRYIAPGQGFFIRVLSGTTGTLVMNDDVRVHHNTSFFKARDNSSYVNLTVTGNGKKDETIIRFMDGTTNNFDGQFDVFKKFSSLEDYPHIYSDTDEKYYINSLPAADLIPISFFAGIAGEYTISINEIKDIGNIWLEDLSTGSYIDTSTGEYAFEYQPEDDPERFVLHFTPVSIKDKQENDIEIFVVENQVFIQSAETISGIVNIYNLEGKLVERTSINGKLSKIPINYQGYYLISVLADQSAATKKVFIQ